MDEKTAALRDIFIEVTEEEAVTESQERARGSLATDRDVDARLADIVASMRERLDFDSTLADDALVQVVRGFYADDSDAAIARDLGDVSTGTVVRARLDLHLVRESDTDAPFDLDEFRRRLDDGDDVAALADHFEVSESTVRRYRRVVEARAERQRVNDRFRSEFESVLRDRDIAERLTEGVHEDGLEEANEGQEVNLSF